MINKVKSELLETYKSYLQVEDDPNYKGLKNINLKSNGKPLGTFELNVDGTWNYYSDGLGGAYPDYILVGIGALLFELNWKDELHESKPGV